MLRFQPHLHLFYFYLYLIKPAFYTRIICVHSRKTPCSAMGLCFTCEVVVSLGTAVAACHAAVSMPCTLNSCHECYQLLYPPLLAAEGSLYFKASKGSSIILPAESIFAPNLSPRSLYCTHLTLYGAELWSLRINLCYIYIYCNVLFNSIFEAHYNDQSRV